MGTIYRLMHKILLQPVLHIIKIQKINGSNPMAQFMVINNRMEIRAHDRSRVTIPSAFHQKSPLLNGKIWINLQNGHFKLFWDHYNFKPGV